MVQPGYKISTIPRLILPKLSGALSINSPRFWRIVSLYEYGKYLIKSYINALWFKNVCKLVPGGIVILFNPILVASLICSALVLTNPILKDHKPKLFKLNACDIARPACSKAVPTTSPATCPVTTASANGLFCAAFSVNDPPFCAPVPPNLKLKKLACILKPSSHNLNG